MPVSNLSVYVFKHPTNIFVIRSSKITVADYHLVALMHSVAASDPMTSICEQYLESRPHPRLQGAAK